MKKRYQNKKMNIWLRRESNTRLLGLSLQPQRAVLTTILRNRETYAGSWLVRLWNLVLQLQPKFPVLHFPCVS